jgi:hypothetical protein
MRKLVEHHEQLLRWRQLAVNSDEMLALCAKVKAAYAQRQFENSNVPRGKAREDRSP